MPSTLYARTFTAAHLATVSNFDCGDDPWAASAIEWIKAPVERSGALKSMADRGNRVWLYFDPNDALVGFGSLGTTRWPKFNEPVSLIPQVAIQSRFQGQPTGEGEIRYSHQIMDDLIGKASEDPPDILVFTVDPMNARAVALYRRFGFIGLTDLSPRGHLKMVLRLR